METAGHDGNTVRNELTPKHIRAYVNGRVVADSQRARIVWFGPVARTYAFPRGDIHGTVGEGNGHAEDPIMGRVPAAPLEHAHGTTAKAVLLPGDVPDLDHHVILAWDAIDTWMEEDEEVFVHPHDPHKRIDILASSREVVVELDGTQIAATQRPTLLFETGLPTRYYLPRPDLEWGQLEPSETRTGCAYKGFARYVHARVDGVLHEDIAWWYRTPFAEAQRVAGLFGFFQERLDLIVDGERLERPDTPWRRDP